MSARVMAALREFTEEVEVYSIDEAFVDLRGSRGVDTYCKLSAYIREKMLKWRVFRSRSESRRRSLASEIRYMPLVSWRL